MEQQLHQIKTSKIKCTNRSTDLLIKGFFSKHINRSKDRLTNQQIMKTQINISIDLKLDKIQIYINESTDQKQQIKYQKIGE